MNLNHRLSLLARMALIFVFSISGSLHAGFSASAETPKFKGPMYVYAEQPDLRWEGFGSISPEVKIADYSADQVGEFTGQDSCSKTLNDPVIRVSKTGELYFVKTSPYYLGLTPTCKFNLGFITPEVGGGTRYNSVGEITIEFLPARVSSFYFDVKAGLALQPGISISPNFRAGATEYVVDVNYAVSSLTGISTVPSGVTAELTGGDNLAVGENAVSLKVSGSHLKDKTYTDKIYNFRVNRLPANSESSLSGLALWSRATGQLQGLSFTPSFNSATTSYTAKIKNSLDKVLFAFATTDSGANIKVNGTPAEIINSWPAVEVPMQVGENIIDVEVTASNGISKTNYQVVVTREAKAPIVSSEVLPETLNWIPGAIIEHNAGSDETAVAWQAQVANSKQKEVWVGLVSKTGKITSRKLITTLTSLAWDPSGWPQSQLDLTAGEPGDWLVTWDNYSSVFSQIVHSTDGELNIKDGRGPEPLAVDVATGVGGAQAAWSEAQQSYLVIWRTSDTPNSQKMFGSFLDSNGEAPSKFQITDQNGKVYVGSVIDVAQRGSGWLAAWTRSSDGALVALEIGKSSTGSPEFGKSAVSIASGADNLTNGYQNGYQPTIVSDSKGTLISYLKQWTPFARVLSLDGTLSTPVQLDTSSQRVRLASSGDGYQATWSNRGKVSVTALTSQGVIGTPTIVQASDSYQDRPTLTYVNSLKKYVATWHESTAKLYSVRINLVGSSDSSLKSLSLGEAASIPSFNSETTRYAVSVGSSVGSLLVSAITSDSNASFVVVGGTSLSAGENTVTVEVTSSDGTSTTLYTIVVTKAIDGDSKPATTTDSGKRTERPVFEYKKNGELILSIEGSKGEKTKAKLKDLSKKVNLSLNGEKVEVSDPKFSGKLPVEVEFTLATGERVIQVIELEINPRRIPSASVKLKSLPSKLSPEGIYENRATLTWKPSRNALRYEVLVDGKVVATTESTKFRYIGLLGPMNVVKIIPLGGDNTIGRAFELKAVQGPIALARTKFPGNTLELTVATRKTLDAVADAVQKSGYKTVLLKGFAEEQATSIAIATTAKLYLETKLDGSSVKYLVRSGQPTRSMKSEKVEIRLK